MMGVVALLIAGSYLFTVKVIAPWIVSVCVPTRRTGDVASDWDWDSNSYT